MFDVIEFEIKGKPVPWQRAGRAGKRTFDTPRNVASKRLIAFAAQDAMRHLPCPFQHAVRIEMVFAWTRPRRSNSSFKATRGDLDNFCKLVLDACQGILFEDDAQVAVLTAQKIFHADEPTTKVTCFPLETEPGVVK